MIMLKNGNRNDLINYDKDHIKILEILELIKIPNLEEINLSKLLFVDTYSSFNFPMFKMLLNTFRVLVFDQNNVVYRDNKSNSIVIIYLPQEERKDHKVQMENFVSLMDNYNELIIDDRQVKITNVFFQTLIEWINVFKLLKSTRLKTRIYLCNKILNTISLKKKIQSIDFDKIENIFVLFDGERNQNYLVQFFRNKGIKTFTLEHGQCLFRGCENDRLNQGIILNFSSDFCICNGKFSMDQFLKAGVDANCLLPLGSLRSSFNVIPASNKKYSRFILFLDSATYFFSKKISLEMIELANEFCEKYNYSYILRPHPADDPSKYKKYISKEYCESIAKKESNIDNIVKKSDFGVFHASAIYVDMLKKNFKMYKFQSEIHFPIVKDENEYFSNAEDLIIKVKKWSSMKKEIKDEHFAYWREYYLNQVSLRERYKDFFRSIGCD